MPEPFTNTCIRIQTFDRRLAGLIIFKFGENQNMNFSSGAKDLIVYRMAFKLAMDIFAVSKTFPKEERYSLTDQIRRSSRSVCVNLSEGYAKRRYPPHFISKLTDSDMELGETGNWLDFALACDYIPSSQHEILIHQKNEVGKILGHMIQYPEKFIPRPRR